MGETMTEFKEVERPTSGLMYNRLPVGAVAAILATQESGKAVVVPLNGVTPVKLREALAQAFYRDYPTLKFHGKRVGGDLMCWVTPRTEPTPNGTGAAG